jgi:ABC-type multidrug transport system ATPase subunit
MICGTLSSEQRRNAPSFSQVGDSALNIIQRMLKESAYKKTKLRYLCDISAHSMEEAEELCDRVGIFVSGNFHCLGTPNEVCTLFFATHCLG